jgi:asparagine synthase (glutamine-hydrolysing)
MCGIFGFIGKKEFDFYKLFMKIKHRGPDQSIFIDNNDYKIGFHRLAIHDLSIKGMQPFMYSDDETTIYITCNGEIYNYVKLKYEFPEYNFKSN